MVPDPTVIVISHHIGYTSSALHFPVYSSARYTAPTALGITV